MCVARAALRGVNVCMCHGRSMGGRSARPPWQDMDRLHIPCSGLSARARYCSAPSLLRIVGWGARATPTWSCWHLSRSFASCPSTRSFSSLASASRCSRALPQPSLRRTDAKQRHSSPHSKRAGSAAPGAGGGTWAAQPIRTGSARRVDFQAHSAASSPRPAPSASLRASVRTCRVQSLTCE